MVGGEGLSLNVVPDGVRDVGRYVFGVAEALRTALDSASTEVSALTGGSWTGTAADEFETGWSEAYSGGVKIVEALAGLAEKLGITAQTYQRRDESNASTMGYASLDLPDLL
ncbi:WXG100 family type VII secretion target [Nocardia arizonensis]|nr:type VII secretion target [Nocardia arizonensis]